MKAVCCNCPSNWAKSNLISPAGGRLAGKASLRSSIKLLLSGLWAFKQNAACRNTSSLSTARQKRAFVVSTARESCCFSILNLPPLVPGLITHRLRNACRYLEGHFRTNVQALDASNSCLQTDCGNLASDQINALKTFIAPFQSADLNDRVKFSTGKTADYCPGNPAHCSKISS